MHRSTDTLMPTTRPNHVITFLRPKPNQPANHATFAVPLRFNKLDLRDYLFHVYNVRVTGVRSFINQVPKVDMTGRVPKWSRGTPQKMMIAVLVQPFKWPDVPAKDEREDFDYDLFIKTDEWTEKTQAEQRRAVGRGLLPSREKLPEDRKKLQEQMEGFVKDPTTWKENDRVIKSMPWTEVEKDVDFNFEEVPPKQA